MRTGPWRGSAMRSRGGRGARMYQERQSGALLLHADQRVQAAAIGHSNIQQHRVQFWATRRRAGEMLFGDPREVLQRSKQTIQNLL